MTTTLAAPVISPRPRTTSPAERYRTLVERLVAIEPGRFRVVSCYLRLEVEDRRRRGYLTELKRRIATAGEPGAARDLERIVRRVERPRALPHARGVAIFACEELELFEVVPLPHVHRSRLVVDDTPLVRELVAAEQEFGTLLAVVLDRAHARFFAVTAFDCAELPSLFETSRRGGKFHLDRRDSPGWGERAYHSRVLEERHRHFEAIAERCAQLLRSHTARGILLAGPSRETAALGRFLPPGLGRTVLGTARLNPTAVTPAEVQTAAFAAAEAHDRAARAALVASLNTAIGTGWGVNGPRETLRALARGQVRTLLVRDDLEAAGFRCGATGRLALSRAECRGEGEAVPVRDMADEAIEEALRQRVHVAVVDAQTAAGAIDALAAILRFR
ncbi:MAG TPA: hypothetical protein VFU46_05245 [Gemmatimonadales bacterium]|nr:hypothetical protein [Gemmatimonadales bacterium]